MPNPTECRAWAVEERGVINPDLVFAQEGSAEEVANLGVDRVIEVRIVPVEGSESDEN